MLTKVAWRVVAVAQVAMLMMATTAMAQSTKVDPLESIYRAGVKVYLSFESDPTEATRLPLTEEFMVLRAKKFPPRETAIMEAYQEANLALGLARCR